MPWMHIDLWFMVGDFSNAQDAAGYVSIMR